MTQQVSDIQMYGILCAVVFFLMFCALLMSIFSMVLAEVAGDALIAFIDWAKKKFRRRERLYRLENFEECPPESLKDL